MADIVDDKQGSATTRVVGDNEEFAVDVVEERGEKKLLVKSNIELSSELRIIQDSPQNIRLTNNGAFLEIFSQTGGATVSGFMIRFDRNAARVRLEIDNIEIFNIDCQQLRFFTNLANNQVPNTYISWNSNENVFYFTPNFPIVGDSISISVVGTSNTTDYLGSFIQVG
jgi:hypothetical protein